MVSYETVRRWVAKFGADSADELRRRWRAVDEHGQTLDVLLQEHRDTAAAERFFRRLVAVAGDTRPAQVTTDKLGSYAAVLARVPTLAGAEHVQVRAASRCNHRVEQAHQPTRIGERVMRRSRSVGCGGHLECEQSVGGGE